MVLHYILQAAGYIYQFHIQFGFQLRAFPRFVQPGFMAGAEVLCGVTVKGVVLVVLKIGCRQQPGIVPALNVTIFQSLSRKAASAFCEGIGIACGTVGIREAGLALVSACQGFATCAVFGAGPVAFADFVIVLLIGVSVSPCFAHNHSIRIDAQQLGAHSIWLAGIIVEAEGCPPTGLVRVAGGADVQGGHAFAEVAEGAEGAVGGTTAL
ncbi:hypothetical protein FGO68_gene16670 [Halteria grandinella]|uniref:Uncharacterized protein n=1 Tax=Halteria grandinella TaxID=5974 RepID=A0A8J8T6I9_HALGN|nr:hypothetical protein FGO68_gene16670 [Halteria grandinella]